LKENEHRLGAEARQQQQPGKFMPVLRTVPSPQQTPKKDLKKYQPGNIEIKRRNRGQTVDNRTTTIEADGMPLGVNENCLNRSQKTCQKCYNRSYHGRLLFCFCFRIVFINLSKVLMHHLKMQHMGALPLVFQLYLLK
jgi:hypothetical protein